MADEAYPVMAYCLLAQAGDLRSGLLKNANLKQLAEKYRISEIQLLLLFVLRNANVIAIPRSSRAEHVLENWEARDIQIEAEDWKAIDREDAIIRLEAHLEASLERAYEYQENTFVSHPEYYIRYIEMRMSQ